MLCLARTLCQAFWLVRHAKDPVGLFRRTVSFVVGTLQDFEFVAVTSVWSRRGSFVAISGPCSWRSCVDVAFRFLLNHFPSLHLFRTNHHRFHGQATPSCALLVLVRWERRSRHVVFSFYFALLVTELDDLSVIHGVVRPDGPNNLLAGW